MQRSPLFTAADYIATCMETETNYGTVINDLTNWWVAIIFILVAI